MFTSYAQAREDVLLVRALRQVPYETGFYIDIGAYDPEEDSVTKLFYDYGWRGINVEPIEHLYKRFVHERARDINIQAAISNRVGEITFYENSGQLGTVVEKFAHEGRSYTVPCTTLTAICEKHVTGEIHFLKVDVEGHELEVLKAMDFKRFRPWILVIEAVEPNRMDLPSYETWDGLVINNGYRFVFTDVLNRYYVAEEHQELVPHFSMPPDDYILNRNRKQIERLETRVGELEQEIAARSKHPSF